jgi:hypothetical protein
MLVLTIFLLSWHGAAIAQGGSAAQSSMLVQMMTLQAKAGMGPEFENVIKTELLPAMKKAGNMAMFTLKTELGQSDSYLFAIPMKSMAELDVPDPLVAALGEKGLAYLMVRLNQLTYSPKIFLTNTRPDMGIQGPANYAPKLFVMVKVKIAPGQEAEFSKTNKVMQTLLAKTEAKGVLVTEVGLGGNIDEYISFLMFDSFADIEKFGVTLTKLAMEGRMPSSAGLIVNREAVVMRFLPEMSCMPAAPKPTGK